MDNISPVLISSAISALIAIVTLIVSTIINTSKHKKDERQYFERILKEKLEYVYSPLRASLKVRKDNDKIIDSEFQNLVTKYGYLLKKETLVDLDELIKFEKNFNSSLQSSEYIALRKKIKRNITKEFNELKDLNEKHFNNFVGRYGLSYFERLMINVLNLFKYITFFVYILVIISFLTYKIYNDFGHQNYLTLYSLVSIIIVIVIYTTIIIIARNVYKFIGYCINRIGKTKGLYTLGEEVSLSDNYKCLACGSSENKIKHTIFGLCKNHTKWQTLKALFKPYLWKRL